MILGSRHRTLSAMITIRAALAALVCIGIGSILIVVMLERTAKAEAQTTGEIVARAIAADVQARFERSIGIVAGMRDALVALR